MDLYIHIGYPKTGTTTLQEELFAKHDDIFYLNQYISSDLFRDVFYARENYVKRQIYNYKNVFRNIDILEGKTVVLSSESFTSYGMFFQHHPQPMMFTVDPNTMARKLSLIFKETKIFDNIYVFGSIRRQDDMIKSMYAQVYNRFFKKHKQTKDFRSFLQYAIENDDNFILDTLQYNYVFDEYERLFGESFVKVLVYEQMKYEPEVFYKNLSEFLGINFDVTLKLCIGNKLNEKSSKTGYKTDQQSLASITGNFKTKYISKMKFGLSGTWPIKYLNQIELKGKILTDIEISKEHDQVLSEIFDKGNKQISKRKELNLLKYNYYHEEKNCYH